MQGIPRWAKKILKDEKSGKVITNAINSEHDKDECYVLRKCLLYLKRHLNRHLMLDSKTMSMICWILGHEMKQIGILLLEHFEGEKRSEFEEDIFHCYLFCKRNFSAQTGFRPVIAYFYPFYRHIRHSSAEKKEPPR